MTRRWLGSWLIASCASVAGGSAALARQDAAAFGPQQMSAQQGSLESSGDVKEPAAVDEHAAPIPPADPVDGRTLEKPVGVPPPAAVRVSRGVPAEVLALDTNMPARVTELLACRMEIATDRRVRLDQVAAGTVLLRWTVQPGGGVTGAETVAKSRRTDPEVLSCARRKMEAWVFIRAPGGEPLPIEQTLKFD
jgi:hypothetical protein